MVIKYREIIHIKKKGDLDIFPIHKILLFFGFSGEKKKNLG